MLACCSLYPARLDLLELAGRLHKESLGYTKNSAFEIRES